MKKLIATIAIFLLAITFTFAFDFTSFATGESSLASLSKEEQDIIIKQGVEEGVTVSFDKIGNMTVIDNETKEKLVFNVDGSYVVYTEDGEEIGAISYGEVLDNELSKRIPSTDDYGFSTVFSGMEEGELSILLEDADLGKAKKYVEALKKKGFTLEAEEEDEDMSAYGMYALTYMAKDKAGYEVGFVYMDMSGTKSCAIRVSKD